MGLLRRIVSLAFAVIVFSASALFFLVLYLKSQPLPPAEIEEATLIYSAEGEVIDTLSGGINRQTIKLDEIPKHVQEATIAIEDRNFFAHYGFDLKRILKALIVDLQEMRKAQGASTITQQLARNLFLSHEKTWLRKIKEALLTVQLELNYSKEEILELYLNQIYYGNSAYGIQSASLTYFGKTADELSLAEGAFLAGIPKGPSYYDPFTHFDNAKKRQKQVLDAMVEVGYISRQEADQAYAEELQLVSKGEKIRQGTAPYFRDAVLKWVTSHFDMGVEELSHRGLRIYTTLSAEMQKKAEEIVAKHLPKDRPLQVALVAIEPKTGYVRAMVGGRDYRESQYNRVFAERQPGSSFKPFLYLTALEQGLTPLTEVESKPTVFQYDGKVYSPKNFGNKYANRPITMMEAIKRSDNIYAVATHMAIGEERLVERVNELGISSDAEALPSLALGSLPVSPLKMAEGYAIFANLGEKVEAAMVQRIEDRNGKVLYEHRPKRSRVADPRYVFILNHMLQGVFDEGGTAHRVVSLLSRPVAGKTGTTPYDNWMIGFTPQLVTAVWVGYDQNKPLTVVDSLLAAPIWAEFTESALADQPPMLFEVPEGVVAVYIDPETNRLATSACPSSQLVYFMPGTEPTEYCPKHGPANKKKEPEPPMEEKKSLWQHMQEWWKSD